MLNETVDTLTTGAVGVGALEAAPVIVDTISNSNFNSIIELILQVVVGVVTLWRLIFKKNKNENGNKLKK